jgi:hypothetical protein
LSSPGDDAVLVLASALAADDSRPTSGLAAAAGDVVAWPDVASAALRHRLAPLLYRRLSDACPDLVPDDVLAELGALYQAANRRSTRLSGQLVRVVEGLAGIGIAALPFKGPTQAQDLYGDVALRQFSDLDIAVAATDVVRALDVLLARGFVVLQPGSEVDETILLRNEGEVILSGDGGDGALVELHWRVGWRFAQVCLPAEELLAEARTIEILGRPVRAPSARDQVLILCVHGAHHAWDGLELMLAVVVASQRIDTGEWAALLDRAARFNNHRRVLVGLVLAHETLAVRPPTEVRLRAAADPAVRGLVDEMRDHWREDAASGGALRRLREIVWLARAEDSATGAVTHVLRRAFTPGPEDWDRAALPHGLQGLYYLWRPLRLAGKFTRLGRRADRPVRAEDDAR